MIRRMTRFTRLVVSTSFVVSSFTSLSFAQTTTGIPADLRKAMEDLKVNIPQTCPIVEKATHSTSGVNLPTTKCTSSTFSTITKAQAKVYRVVDGDTIHVYIGAHIFAIRMLGVDTPELHFWGRSQPKWGEIARQSLAAMVRAGDTVTVEFDKQKCDKYGRILVHVFKNGMNLGLEQIRRGMASNYCIAPNLKYCGEYADAYARAASSRLNMHADKCVITPYVWRKGLQGMLMDKTVKNRHTGATYAPMDYVKVPVADRIFIQNTAQ
jgi:micrococcal nuclease